MRPKVLPSECVDIFCNQSTATILKQEILFQSQLLWNSDRKLVNKIEEVKCAYMDLLTMCIRFQMIQRITGIKINYSLLFQNQMAIPRASSLATYTLTLSRCPSIREPRLIDCHIVNPTEEWLKGRLYTILTYWQSLGNVKHWNSKRYRFIDRMWTENFKKLLDNSGVYLKWSWSIDRKRKLCTI